jgi:hypothetical protein
MTASGPPSGPTWTAPPAPPGPPAPPRKGIPWIPIVAAAAVFVLVLGALGAMGALATVDCGPASPAGGPTSARYSLFADQAAVDKAFDQLIGAYTPMVRCPGSNMDSPTTWNFERTPEKVEGRIACGTYKDSPGVTWTKNSDLLLGDTLAQNMDDLYNWWLQYA